MAPDHSIPVGYVRRAHGIGGDVVVRGMVADAAERFISGAVRHTGESQPREFTIESTRIHRGDFLVSLAGVHDKTSADGLIGVQFVIDASQRRLLEADEWWAEDVIGCDVVTVDGTRLGPVVDVVTGTAQDRLVVRVDHDNGDGLDGRGMGDQVDERRAEIPLVDELVPSVDIARKIVTVDLPAGLIDE